MELERAMASARRPRRSTAGATTELPAAERPPSY